MDSSIATFAMSTPTIVLSYAAAFFFVVVAIAAAYALFKAGGTLGRVDTVLSDVDREAVPLMQKAGVTLDGVNANLGNVDEITKDVADITDKIDAMATAVEGAVSTPARKAASFSAGVQGAVSSFMRRDKTPPAGDTGPGLRPRRVDRLRARPSRSRTPPRRQRRLLRPRLRQSAAADKAHEAGAAASGAAERRGGGGRSGRFRSRGHGD